MKPSFNWRRAISQARRFGLAAVGVVAVVGLFPSIGRAFDMTYRGSFYTIDFTKADFSDAVVNYTAVVSGKTFPNEAFSFQVDVKPFFQNYKFSYNNLRLTGGQSLPNSAQYNVVSFGNQASYAWSYSTPVATSPTAGFAESWIRRSPTTSGDWSLEFYGGGSTTDTATQIRYDLAVSIVGDWSNQDKTAGILSLFNLNPGYTVVKNFVYDANTNRTHFYAQNDDWDGNSPELYFGLSNPIKPKPVPEPATMAGAMIVASSLAVLRRRVRSH